MKRKVEIALTKNQAGKITDMIDSFQDLMAHYDASKYRDCLKAAAILLSKLNAEIERIEKLEATDAKLAGMLKRFRASRKASTP